MTSTGDIPISATPRNLAGLATEEIGVVVIGRNEGERLQRCLRSVVGWGRIVVYVDSGSTDDSVAFARSLGVNVIELDMSRPFTAARARNAGFDQLLKLRPYLEYVQFVDGDCEIVDGWFECGLKALADRPDVVVVFGRVRERYPDRSVYNRLCDLEWDRPVGEVDACGGIAMMRLNAFRAAGGFNPGLIAGEEPELCLRMRVRGGKILRIEPDMTLHDAAMLSFRQWWRRSVRAGHAFAEGMAMHGGGPERHCVRWTCSALFWSVVVPFVSIGGARATAGLSLLLLTGYFALGFRVYRHHRWRGRSFQDSCLMSISDLVAKWPQSLGIMHFWCNRLRGRRTPLIEHK